MNRIRIAAATVALALALSSVPVFAATKTYQVTGSVIAVDDATITVDKKGEKFEIARGADTKVTGDVKVGAKVTVEYRMSAATIEAKAETAAKKTKKK
jgi:hypothetical protein